MMDAIEILPNARCVCVAILTNEGRYHAFWGGGTPADENLLTMGVLAGTLGCFQPD